MIRRFYREVTIENAGSGWQVMLDGRGVKTVGGSPQIVPTQSLAQALGAEWAQQGERIDPASLPLRDMADYALDIAAQDTAAIAGQLAAYGDTDTLCYRADPEEPLYARQMEIWEPLVEDFEQRYNLRLVRVSGVIHRAQDTAALAAIEAQMKQHNAFILAGLETMTTLAASLITGLLALETAQQEGAARLWQAVCLEEEWQANLWGRDAEAEERRARRAADFLRAWGFARLARAQ